MEPLSILKERLDEAEQRLSMAMEAGEIGVWEWQLTPTPETGSLLWDARMFQVFGLPQQGWRGTYQDFADCLEPESLTVVNQRIAATLKTGMPYDYYFRLKNGRLVRGRGKLFYDSRGNPERMVGVCIRVHEGDIAEVNSGKST
jgi:diguanylate cyclase